MVALIKSIYRKSALGKDFSAHNDDEAVVERGERDAGRGQGGEVVGG